MAVDGKGVKHREIYQRGQAEDKPPPVPVSDGTLCLLSLPLTASTQHLRSVWSSAQAAGQGHVREQGWSRGVGGDEAESEHGNRLEFC